MNGIFKVKVVNIVLLLLFSILLISNISGADGDTTTVAITPFTINAAKDMGYLKSGIQDMLESRLSQEEKVMVVSDAETAKAMQGFKEPLQEKEAREIGQKLNARYVLIGSMTVLGSSISMDAKLVDVSGQKATLAFFEQSENIDEMVPKINRFALDLNTALVDSTEAAAAAQGVSAMEPEAADDVHAHPEKLNQEDSAQPHGFIAAETEGLSGEIWKSRQFKILMNGIALGDVDGDGKTETVIVTPDSVIVYKIDKNQMFKFSEFDGDRFEIMIGVDVADINGNGYAEIFVTTQNTQKNRVYSDVFEYDGSKFVRTVDDSPWKFRVVEAPQGAPILLGQKHFDPKPFAGPVFKLKWTAGDYQPGEQVGPANGCNLMGFTYGNATNSGANSVVAYDAWDKLTVFSSSGERLWKHTEKTGGSTLLFSIGKIGPDEEGIQYLPMRVIIMDIDADGRNEVIAVKNHEIMNNVLLNFRQYKHAEIQSYHWDDPGLSLLWKTKMIDGYMRDFALGDHDNDGRDELVVALVLKEGRIAGTTPRSRVISYQF